MATLCLPCLGQGGTDIIATTKNVYSTGCGMVGDQTSNSYQVYVNPDKVYTRLGCLKGFDPSTISSSFVLSEGTASYDVNSCGAMAVVQSNLLFGFSPSGSVCFVGDESAQVVIPAYSQDCDSPGSIKVYVQTVSLPETSPQSLYQSIGCYRDDITRVIPIDQSSASSSSFSPADCALKAENTDAIVFGLQNGGECRTGDSVSSAISLSPVSKCPLFGSSLANQVFVRKYCFPEWTTVSSYTGNVLTFECRKCSKGFYCPGDNTEVPCDMDYSTQDMEGAVNPMVEYPLAVSHAVHSVGQPICKPIPEGYYLIDNNTPLKYCGTNNKMQHWIGGGYSKKTCRCAPHWTGYQCDIPTCPNELPFVSLGTLLFNSDSTLLQARNLDISNTLRYLYNLLSVSIDVTGDGIITKEEMLKYLYSRSIYSIGMETFPLWYAPDKTPRSIYGVMEMYNEAYELYQTSPKHKFDGSGLTFISNLVSTFPNASWDNSKCNMYDVSRPNHSFVETSWNFTKGSAITKVCGYINGNLSTKFSTDEILYGRQTNFTDTILLSTTANYKRVYCVFVFYTYMGKSLNGFECSVGLFYDGTPIDLKAELASYGIVFSYLDTSTTESKFDIFVGHYNSPEESKQFVVGIPYSSQGCGRISTHISFVDNLNRNSVGALFEYGVRAVQVVGDTPVPTAMTLNAYRIPYFIQVGVTVKNAAGKGIFNVTVSFCHIDPYTAENDLDPLFCPVLVVTTDKRGLATGIIRVSSPLWVNQLEQFNVTASFVEEIITGQTVTHEFSPPSQILTFSHTVGVGSVTIQDVTKVKIYGQVLFDPKLLGGVTCPFANVPVNYLDFSGAFTNTTSGPDGRFNFTTGYREFASVYIPEYLGNNWRVSMVTWKNFYYQRKWQSPTAAPVVAKLSTSTSAVSISNMKAAKSLLSTSAAADDRQFSLQESISTYSPSIKPTSRPSYEFTSLPTIKIVPQVQGLMFRVFNGYFNDDLKFFKREFEYATGYSDDFSSITSASGGYVAAGSGQSLISIEWFGYILTPPGTTGVWTISLTSDDSGLLWLGDSALTSYSTSNSLIMNNGVHTATTKIATKYFIENSSYPIRIQYGQFIDNYQLVLSLSTPKGLTTTGSGYFFSSPTPTTAPSTAPTFAPSAVTIVGSGLYFRVFQGYFGDDINFFSLHTSYAEGFSSDLSSVSAASNGYLVETNTQVLVSIEWFGYLRIPTDSGGLWNFTLSSDDSSIMWLGDNAVSDYTASNAFISNIGVHSLKSMRNAMNLLEDLYYPIRIQYGQYQDDYNLIVTATSPSGITSHGNGILFTGAVPTSHPVSYPTIAQSTIPTLSPSRKPTAAKTTIPSTRPTARPIFSPSPTVRPTSAPSFIPTIKSTTASPVQTTVPSDTPSLSSPTISSSTLPSISQSLTPTMLSSYSPSVKPSSLPSIAPTSTLPSMMPSFIPSVLPSFTSRTSSTPTTVKSIIPSSSKTISPTIATSNLPSSSRSVYPSIISSYSPSVKPSRSIPPTTRLPSRFPTSTKPTALLTATPSKIPSSAPKVIRSKTVLLGNYPTTVVPLSSSVPDELPKKLLLTKSDVVKSNFSHSHSPTEPIQPQLRKQTDLVSEKLSSEQLSPLTRIFSAMTNMFTTKESTPSCSQRSFPTETPSYSPSNSLSLIPTTTIPTLEPTFPIYNGLLFTLHTGVGNSPTGYAQNFASLYSATDFTIGNDSTTSIFVQRTGYFLTPEGSTGSWTFWSLSDGAVNVWIGKARIISGGTNTTSPSSFSNSSVLYFPLSNSTTLNSNTYYPIRISYESANPQKTFKLLFTSPISKISSDFSSFFYYCEQPLVVSTISPSTMPTKKPTFKPTRKPATARPTRVPTAEPTLSSDKIQGLLFNVYSSDYKQDPKFFSKSVPYLAGFATDLGSLSSSVQNQVLLPGEISIEWFGYISTKSSSGGQWSFTITSDSPGYFWIGKNAVSGYVAQDVYTFSQSKSASFTVTLFGGTDVPIRIQVGSSSLKTFKFQFTPPGSGPVTDGFDYFYSKRPSDISTDEVVMMHEYLFDSSELNGNILTDVVGSLPAYKSPSVTVKNGQAVFDDPSKPQFIQLHPSILLFSKSFSIELWAEFDSSNNPSSTLFSFGPKSDLIHFNASFNRAVYIAVVYSSNSSSVYVDGVLTRNTSFNFNGSPPESIMGYNFIGRNILGT